mgnify:CR=1 FL=1
MCCRNFFINHTNASSSFYLKHFRYLIKIHAETNMRKIYVTHERLKYANNQQYLDLKIGIFERDM